MPIYSALSKYISARSNGNTDVVRRYEKKAITMISRRTYGKTVLAYFFSFAYRLLCSSESDEEINSIIKAHVSEKKWNNKEWLSHIKRDIYFTVFYNRINADEFFRYQFETLSETGRHAYVGIAETLDAYRKLDDPEEQKILENKYNTYCFFKDYYKREAIQINGFEDAASFYDFCSRNSEFFVKPLSMGNGIGICSFNVGRDGDKEALFKKIINRCPVIIEQPIRQAEEMAKYHPRSVNTIRVVTVQKEGIVRIVQTSVRLGVGDAIIDNISHSGLSAAVDTGSGIIITPGRAAHRKELFLRHPDTNEQIIGNRIPDWENLLQLVKLLASKFGKQRIIGWDMAYSVEGWVVVEANSHPGIQILAESGVGVREVFEDIIR